MRFKTILECLLILSLCVCLMSEELWLRHGFAAQKSQIVFVSNRDGNAEIYVMGADGRNQVRLTNNPTDDGDPSWSPDGQQIAFVSNRNGGFIQIYVMDADGKNPTRLTDGVWDTDPDWSPDGQQIAFTSMQDGRGAHIAVMDSDGNNLSKLEDNAADPSWSPDGQQIAFVSWRDRSDEIYVIGVDGNGLRRVTHDLAPKLSPSFSPDGRRIAYGDGHERFFHIYVVGADGRNRNKLTHNQEHNMCPAWSPDGQTIAYVVSNDIFPFKSTIHLMTADGKYLKQLSEVHKGSDNSPDFSPMGLAVSPASNTATIWGRLKKPAPDLR